MSEFKKFDSDDTYIQHNARLTADAETKEYNGGKMVKLKFVSEAKGSEADPDRYETLWVEATIGDFDAEKAALLKKGDVLTIEGKPALRLWGDNNDKYSFELRRARLHLPVSLFMELKERGFGSAKPTVGKVTRPIAKKSFTKRPIVEIPDEE